MRCRDLFEIYSTSNRYLRDYLKSDGGGTAGRFDPYHYWWVIPQWVEHDDEAYEAFADILGKEDFNPDDLEEEEPDLFYQLPEHLQRDAAEWATEHVMQHDPTSAASTEWFSLQNKKLLPRQTWLVHFTDDPDRIAEVGFTHGTDDMTRLGLTTYMTQNSKQYGGYNFAFIADSRYARYAASQGKYGKQAVMFQNSGVHVWHYSDEEDQIIFWGKDVQPRDIVVLHRDYDEWTVQSRGQRQRYADRDLFKGDFETCVAWVIANFQQYRKALTGF